MSRIALLFFTPFHGTCFEALAAAPQFGPRSCCGCDSNGVFRIHTRGLLGNIAVAKVLVVDDDPAVLSMIKLVLERAGHGVVVAGDGSTGLRALESDAFDLVLLDIFMPGMDGLETMRMVRQARPMLPIIVISGRPVTDEARQEPDFLGMATKLGATYSLPKPFKPPALLSMVALCLKAESQGSPDRDVASGR
jgi:CheY-like chemotaxis protein